MAKSKAKKFHYYTKKSGTHTMKSSTYLRNLKNMTMESAKHGRTMQSQMRMIKFSNYIDNLQKLYGDDVVAEAVDKAMVGNNYDQNMTIESILYLRETRNELISGIMQSLFDQADINISPDDVDAPEPDIDNVDDMPNKLRDMGYTDEQIRDMIDGAYGEEEIEIAEEDIWFSE